MIPGEYDKKSTGCQDPKIINLLFVKKMDDTYMQTGKWKGDN